MRTTIIIILKTKNKKQPQTPVTQSFPDAALVICLSGRFSFCFFNRTVGFIVLTLHAVLQSDLRCHEHCFQKNLVSELFRRCKEETCLTLASRRVCWLAYVRTGAMLAPGWLVSGSPISRMLGWSFFESSFYILKPVGPTILEPWPQLALSLFSSVFRSERKALWADCYIRKNPKEVLWLPGGGHLPSPYQQQF